MSQRSSSRRIHGPPPLPNNVVHHVQQQQEQRASPVHTKQQLMLHLTQEQRQRRTGSPLAAALEQEAQLQAKQHQQQGLQHSSIQNSLSARARSASAFFNSLQQHRRGTGQGPSAAAVAAAGGQPDDSSVVWAETVHGEHGHLVQLQRELLNHTPVPRSPPPRLPATRVRATLHTPSALSLRQRCLYRNTYYPAAFLSILLAHMC